MTIKIIIDASNASLGRIASYAAKQALLGKPVLIVNCNAAVISGRKDNIIQEYRISRIRGGSSLKGPNFPKNPEQIMKRTVRGMLSYKQARGRDALKRVLCYNDTPPEYENTNKISLSKKFKVKTLKLKELSEKI